MSDYGEGIAPYAGFYRSLDSFECNGQRVAGGILRNRISTKWDFNTTLIIYFVELCSSFTFLRNESNIYRKQFSIFVCLFFVCIYKLTKGKEFY